MESKTFVALTDEQLVMLSWAMDLYYRTVTLEGTDGRITELRNKMRKHAAPAWERVTADYE